MTNQLTKVFKGNDVRILEAGGQVWFAAKDVCNVLEIKNTTDVIKRLDADEVTRFNLGSLSGEMNFVNEQGLYNLIFGSRKPEAKEFKRWVTHEVLPSIRKHGAYMTEQTLERTMADPDFLIGLLTNLKQEQQARKELEVKVEEQKPKVAFADSVEVSVNSISIKQLSVLLKQKGVDIGQNRLFEYLRENGYLVKFGQDKNEPKQKYLDQGLFEVRTGTTVKSDGKSIATRKTLVTGKGQIYFVNKFLKQ